MNKNAWFPEQFSEIEVEYFVLKNAYKQDRADFTFINFFTSNAFTNAFYLQMCQNGNQLTLSRSTLNRSDFETEKSYVLIEEATIAGMLVNQLLRLLKRTPLNAFSMDENNVQWRDGEKAVLTVGRNYHKSTFSWWRGIDPEDWQALDIIADKILEINEVVDYNFSSKQYFELEMDGSLSSSIENKKEKSLLLTYKEKN